jgi:uncharacterized integral membrane protein
MTTQIEVYQGQFGEFTITEGDRQGVIIYRAGLMIAALSFTIGSGLLLWQGATPFILQILTTLFVVFSLGLGVSLMTIHIYFIPLHNLLKIFWLIGIVSGTILTINNREPLALLVYNQPINFLGIGFIFAALTGIYFKEAFCFNRLETKFLTPLVPFLLLGHWLGIVPVFSEKVLLGIWAILFIVFAVRKVLQPIPPDIGDKSVFTYLKEKGTK